MSETTGTGARPGHPAAGLAAAARDGIVPVCYLVGAVLVASGLLHLAVAGISGRPWEGPVSWRKPATFGLSFGTTLVSVVWVSSFLRLRDRTRAVLLGVFAADCVVEVGGITLQAWRGVPSHFDTETPFDSAVAYTLAVGGAVLVAVLGLLALTAFRGRVEGPASLRLALRGGFALLLAGLAAGVAMIARGTVLVRTGHRAAAYQEAGFLKVFHGVTLHAVLVLPLLAWWLSRRDVPEPRRRCLVGAALAGYVTVAAVTLAVSLATMAG